MDLIDKERIEMEAMRYATQWPVHINQVAHNSFVIGATAEHERMEELIEKAFVAGRSKTTWEQFKTDCLRETFRPHQQP